MMPAQKTIKEFLLAIALGLSVGFSGSFLPTKWAIAVQLTFVSGVSAYATWLLLQLLQATRKSRDILKRLQEVERKTTDSAIAEIKDID